MMSPEIGMEAFEVVDIRCGTIVSAVAIPKSEKLLKTEVSLGAELGVRTIVGTLAKSYMPESLVGMRVLAVVNLAPRKVMGEVSNGMLLMAESASGESLLLGGCPGAPDGARLR